MVGRCSIYHLWENDCISRILCRKDDTIVITKYSSVGESCLQRWLLLPLQISMFHFFETSPETNESFV